MMVSGSRKQRSVASELQLMSSHLLDFFQSKFSASRCLQKCCWHSCSDCGSINGDCSIHAGHGRYIVGSASGASGPYFGANVVQQQGDSIAGCLGFATPFSRHVRGYCGRCRRRRGVCTRNSLLATNDDSTMETNLVRSQSGCSGRI